MEKSIDLFLSHNNADKPWAERLAIAIEADRGGPPLKVFFDKWDIPPGGDIPMELERGLQNSRYVGLVLSPESVASDWVALERSTIIYGDPRARERRLLPLLRRDCNIPLLLARLRHIDFRRDQDFNESLDSVISILRGRAVGRGSDVTESDIYFREDAALLKQHRRIFNRSAFQTSCIMELRLSELDEAIDASSAAINTGSLYGRNGNLLSSFPDENEYRLPEFKQTFLLIGRDLTQLKRAIVNFEVLFESINPHYSRHKDFYSMMTSFTSAQPSDIRTLIDSLDSIDHIRNQILDKLNRLLYKCGEEIFCDIKVSSDIIRSNQLGNVNGLSQILFTDDSATSVE